MTHSTRVPEKQSQQIQFSHQGEHNARHGPPSTTIGQRTRNNMTNTPQPAEQSNKATQGTTNTKTTASEQLEVKMPDRTHEAQQ